MDANRAFALLQAREMFSEAEAEELARALGVVWDGRAKWTAHDGQILYRSDSLLNSFKTATRCRPLGGISTR